MCDTVHFLSLEHAMKYGGRGVVAPYCGEKHRDYDVYMYSCVKKWLFLLLLS